MSDFIQLL